MTNAALQRKLARMNSGYGGTGNYPQACPPFQGSPRDYLVQEQDRRREYLAEELVKIFAEEADPYAFVDDTRKVIGDNTYTTEMPSLTVSEWAEKLARAALAAATVLYPEVPEPLNDALPVAEGGEA
jgi:hypothetical protein